MNVNIPPGPTAKVEISVPENLLGNKDFDRRLETAVFDAALEGRSFWETLAGQRLTTSRERYKEAIGMEQIDIHEVHLVLKGKFANMVELGAESFDMKPGFLSSPKVKTGKRRKFPRAIAASLPKQAATRWIVVPLNLNRQAPFTSPTAFRTVTDKQTSLWKHPGLKAMDIRKDVAKELSDNIIPKHVKKVIKELGGD